MNGMKVIAVVLVVAAIAALRLRQGHEQNKRLAALLNVPEGHLRQYLGITPTTFSRRAATDRLSTVESDRLCSLVGALDTAHSLFENDLGMASEWMRSPAMRLDSRLPLEMMRTRVEAEAVFELIGRLKYGVCV